MTHRLAIVLSAAAVALSLTASAEPMSREQAVTQATAAHPGELIKAYQETRRGVETWEVKIKGDDGAEWELYYSVEDGKLLEEKKEE